MSEFDIKTKINEDILTINDDFDINTKFNFVDIENIDNKSNPNNIYNKILTGTIQLTDDILILLIILNITEKCETYLDLYNNAYNSINYDNTIINQIYFSFYSSINPLSGCNNLIYNLNLYWLYRLCVSDTEFEIYDYLINNFKIKYKKLQIKCHIKELFNYDIDLLENNIHFNRNNNYNLFVDTCKKIHNGYYNNYFIV